MDTEIANHARHLIHQARGPLNRISMQAELVKLALEGDLPPEKALDALTKIIQGTKDCSAQLAELSALFTGENSD